MLAHEKVVMQSYKRTEVGLIPIDWEEKTLKDILRVIGGGAFSSKDAQISGLRWLKIANVGINQIIWDEQSFLPEAFENEFKTFLLKRGDVVIALTRPILGSNLKIAKLSHFDGPCLLNQRVGKIENKAKNDLTYIYHLLQKSSVIEAMQKSMAGTDPPNLSNKGIYSIQIPLPPTFEEQRAIATALSDVDALITSLDALITKKRNIKQGTMQQLLTGKKRLPGFNGEWKAKKLGDISYMKGRIGWQGLNQKEFTDNPELPFLITGMNFKDGAIRWDEVYHISFERYEIAKEIQLKTNDVLMTKDGTIGKLLFIDQIPFPNVATLNSHLLVFRPIFDSYFPKFLYYNLSSKSFKDFIELSKSGTTFFGISQESVSKYEILLPKISEQRAIAQILSDMDAEIEHLELKRAKYKAVKQGMMQQLLTGKIRLI